MELINSPKSNYLLEAGIEVLHQQSVEWMSEIAFWRDEIAFYYDLIEHKDFKSTLPKAKDSLEKIQSELIRITSGELDELKQEIEAHEYFLAQMLKGQKMDEQEYRDKHHRLNDRFDNFENSFRTLKKKIFDLIKPLGKVSPLV